MIPPEMPTGLSIRQPVLDNNPKGKFDNSVGVMRTGSGQVGRVNVEIYVTFRAMMHGIDELNIDGPPFGTTAEVPELSPALAVFSAH